MHILLRTWRQFECPLEYASLVSARLLPSPLAFTRKGYVGPVVLQILSVYPRIGGQEAAQLANSPFRFTDHTQPHLSTSCVICKALSVGRKAMILAAGAQRTILP
ncbi:hypothetical protein CERSUDRAFT_116694 [Gelatoporia subvermispora B]|uniref:Uncharacterized protein n=1 Tax=Ceriporiopsis subvermispora (strain B) TaxID=914234 RepID=M2PF65_CERS8|nr:hypothetical protein CERSUDRAFT_116694 [Gelatoporia subvermispora B]